MTSEPATRTDGKQTAAHKLQQCDSLRGLPDISAAHTVMDSAARTQCSACVQLPLFIAGVMFITGAIIMAAAGTVALLVVGRLILGIGVGLSSLVSSLLLGSVPHSGFMVPPSTPTMFCARGC